MDGKRVLMGPRPEKTPDYFKASDMLSMEIERIDEFVSVNITDGPKIWAAMQASLAQLSH